MDPAAFREIRSCVIAHPDGFTVDESSGVSRWLIYSEGDHHLKVFVEPGAGGYIYYMDRTIAWEPPHDGEVLSSARQEQIKDRIVAALRFRGYVFHLQYER